MKYEMTREKLEKMKGILKTETDNYIMDEKVDVRKLLFVIEISIEQIEQLIEIKELLNK